MPGRMGRSLHPSDLLRLHAGGAPRTRSARCSGLAGRGQQRAVLGEHVHQAVAEAVAPPRAPGCRAAPTRWARAGRPAGCCRGCCRRRGAQRLADTHRHEVAEDGERGGVDHVIGASITSGMRAHTIICPSPGVPSSSSKGRPFTNRCSRCSLIVPSTGMRCGRTLHFAGGGTSGICLPLAHRRRADRRARRSR
jgi:hypothetical protein